MGTLVKRSNGIYCAVFSFNGKRIWRTTRTSSLEEAKVIMQGLSLEYRSWKNLTVTGFQKQLLELLHNNLANSTILLYAQALTKFKELIGDLSIRNLQPYHVEMFKAKRLQEVSPTKVNIDFRTLRSAFNRALKMKMIESNPFTDCSNVRLTEMEPVYLNQNEFEKLLRLIDDQRFRCIVLLAVATSMRAGEIVNLKWEDVDLSSGFIHLKNKEDFILKGKRKRSIPLNKTALEVLARIPRESDYVFSREKLLIHPVAAISSRFKRYVRKAKLSEKIHFHSLRHTGASWLVQQGVPISFIQKILGHSQISTTLIYAHHDHQHLREAVFRIDQLITMN